jgi:DNA modification methylase
MKKNIDNEIICGDSLEVLKTLPDGIVDLVLTDPPYRQSFSGGGCIAKKYERRKKDMLPLCDFEPLPFLELVKSKMRRVNMFIWCSKDLLFDYIKFAKDGKYNWNLLIWAKNNPIPAYNNTFLADTEYCICIRETGSHWTKGLGYNSYRKVMFDNVANNSCGHPTQKHLWMFKKIAASYPAASKN